MKIEKRGKYAGVKIHLDAEECSKLIRAAEIEDFRQANNLKPIVVPLKLAIQMGQEIRNLLKEEPNLLQDRSSEEVAAILAKEVEKAQMQLNAVKSGKKWQKVDPAELEKALLKHVKK